MKKAFTLIEILIVVILLGILAAVVIPQFVDQTDTAREAAALATQSNLNSAWQQYVAAQIAAGTPVAAPAAGADLAGTLATQNYINEAPDTAKFTVTHTGNGALPAQEVRFTVVAVD